MDRFLTTDSTGLTLHIPALPYAPAAFVWLTVLVLVALLGLAVWWARPRLMRFGDRIAHRYRQMATPLGLEALPAAIGTGLFLLWLAIFAALLLGMLWVPWMLARQPVPRDASGAADLRWYLLTLTALTAAVGAVAAVPFTLLRTVYNSRQTRTAEENLITGLINKAIEGLGAEKTVNRRGRSVSWTEGGRKRNRLEWHDETYPEIGGAAVDDLARVDPGPWMNFEVTLPNPEVRLGAIYALEHIAQDSDRDHVRIMEILCAYVRENAPARGAQDLGLGDWPGTGPETGPETSQLAGQVGPGAEARERRRRGLAAARESLARNHRIRTDLLAALEVIGRRSDRQIALEEARPARRSDQRYRLDLRGTNLQAADLSNLHFANVLMSGARLEGADLRSVRLDSADLRETRLEGANLTQAQLQRADLRAARLEGAILHAARLDGANLRAARLEMASLREAALAGATLTEVRLEAADLGRARLDGANLFGAGLEAARLSDARLDGAHLIETRLSPATRFDAASLRGAGLKGLALAGLDQRPNHLGLLLTEAFGDASVSLPEGLRAGEGKLAHWSREALDLPSFYVRWRAHQQAVGYSPPG